MSAHPSSVIDPTIADFDQELYDSLINKENYCYTESSLLGQTIPSDDGPPVVNTLITESHLVSFYSPYFSELMVAIDEWKAIDRQLRLFSLVGISYAFHSLHLTYGVGSLDMMTDADTVFFAGVFDTIKDNPSNYFDDITDPFDLNATPSVGDEFDGPGSATNLEASIAEMYGAPAGEEGRVRAAEGAMQPTIMAHSMNAMFSDPEQTGTPPTKDDQTEKILVDLGYGNVIRATGTDLPLPDGV
jgi:hypothetical protein